MASAGFEHRKKVRHAQELADARGEVHQLQFAARSFRRDVESNQSAEPGAIHVPQFTEVQDYPPLSGSRAFTSAFSRSEVSPVRRPLHRTTATWSSLFEVCTFSGCAEITGSVAMCAACLLRTRAEDKHFLPSAGPREHQLSPWARCLFTTFGGGRG